MSFLLTCHAPRLFRSTWIVRALVALVLIIISGVGSLVAQAAPPEIRDIYPRGLQSGGTTRLVVQGEHLDEGTRLVLPVQPPERVRVVKASPTHLELEVTLSEHVDANLYPLRVANTKGISSAVAIGVDRLPQRAFAARIDSLPIALHGTLAGDQVLVTQFVGLEGQELVIDVEGQRLGSALRPVIRLLSADGRQVAMARPLAALAGDTRLSVKLPTSGEYRIELHDAVYQGPAPGWFRMKIGSLLYANRVYPHAASNLGVSEIEYLGSNLPSKGAIGPSLTATPGALSRPVPWPQGSPVVAQSLSNGVFTGSQPKLAISEFGPAEWTEQQVKSSRPTLLPPLGINGRLERPHEQDSYAFDVLPGSRLRVALEAASFGSPLDGILDVFAGELDAAGKPTGGSLGHADDQSGSADPMLDVQVPADVQKISVRISSLIAEGGPEYDYRLSVQAVDAIPPLLTIDANRINVPAGGQVVAPVRIQHVGMKRPLRLQLSTPTGSPLTIADTVVDPEEDLALVQFSVGNPNTRAVFLERVLAVAEDWSLERPGILVASALPGSKYQSDWRHDLAIAVTEPAPLSLELGTFPDEEQVMDVQPSHWLRGARQPLAVRIQRPPGGHTGPVRLSLISSQTPPTKSENNQTVPDTPRIWRILENVVAPSNSSEATLTLVTPADLPLRNWSLAVQGELLSDDGQTVLAIVHSPVLRRPAQDPLTLTSSPPPKVSIAAGDETVLTIEGQITRNVENGLPVEVRLDGLPAELSAIQVTVASDQRDWQLPIQFPNNVKPQEIKEVRIVARYANADDTWRDVVSSTQPFALEIAAPPQ